MRSRRGISSVVGMVFALIALSSVLVYINYSFNTLDQYGYTVLAANQQKRDQTLEKFTISSVTVPSSNSKLNITLINSGNLPVNITKLWIQNTTAMAGGNDWTRNYALSKQASPGGTLINIGQTVPLYINAANSYNVKLVTSRGNTQQFVLASTGAAPLNIQLLAAPSSVTSGFTTKLIMIVTNNGSSTLANVTPSALPAPSYTGSGTTVCTAGAASPTKYATLAPGGTAIFTWDVTATGAGADTCTYTITQPLQNGYLQTLATTITLSTVSLSSTTYATNSGVISDSYTTFKWTQGAAWHNHWSFPSGTTTDFQIQVTNNNQTAGGYKLWLSSNTQLYLLQTQLPANGKIVATPYYLVNAMPANPATPPSLAGLGYTDYTTGIANGGGQTTLYFGASATGGTTQQTTSNMVAGTYFGFVLVYGKFAVNSGDVGSSYAQAIPFIAVVMT